MADNLSSASITAANAKPAVTTFLAKAVADVEGIPNWIVSEVETLELDAEKSLGLTKGLVVGIAVAFMLGLFVGVIL